VYTLFLEVFVNDSKWAKVILLEEEWILSELRFVWNGWANFPFVNAKAFFVIFVTMFALFVDCSRSKDHMVFEKR
jgi:hypothetical protein